ncbi:glycosyltransferase [Nocardioides convexus]|uniref:glycosyltransferase n=1 Tax=Nocardioides convexus TaxID=2712224 RepID=UPI002418A218|nr:glycosyltransferase [Nocardioides convexus]
MRVQAVVVTFNRLAMLQRLVPRLRETPGLERVLVVDNASTDGTGEWLAGLDDPLVRHRTLPANTGGAGGFHDGLGWAVEEGADLVWLMDDDGLPDPDCLESAAGARRARRPGVLRPGGARRAGPLTAVLPDPPARRHDGRARDGRGRGRREGWAHRRGGHPLQRGAGHPRPGRADRPGARGVLHLGRRRGVPLARGAGRRPDRHGRRRPLPAPGHRRPRHADDVRPHDVQPHGERPQALLHGPQQHPEPAGVPRVGARAAVLAQDRVVLPAHQAATGAGPAQRAGRGRRPARRLHRPPAVPAMSAPERTAEKVAVVVVTYNRADLLERMLAGLAALDRAPDAVLVVNNASTDHTRDVLEGSTLPGLVAIHASDNLGGAGGFHLGLKTAYEQGYDVMWLMDDDVVPAPDCLTRLLGAEGSCLIAVREDLTGALVEKAALRFDLRNPLAIRPKTASIDSAYSSRAEMPATVAVENVAFEGFLVRREVVDAIGLPDPSYFIFYDDVDYAIRARRAGFAIHAVRDAVLVRQLLLRPAARPGRVEGLLHVPQPLRRPLPVRRERRGPAQAVAGRVGGRPAQSAAGWSGRGAERVASASGCPGDASPAGTLTGSGTSLDPPADPVARRDPGEVDREGTQRGAGEDVDEEVPAQVDGGEHGQHEEGPRGEPDPPGQP